MHEVWMVWGNETYITWRKEECISHHSFDTEKELKTFLLGVFTAADNGACPNEQFSTEQEAADYVRKICKKA